MLARYLNDTVEGHRPVEDFVDLFSRRYEIELRLRIERRPDDPTVFAEIGRDRDVLPAG